jgi:hypothetical protein
MKAITTRYNGPTNTRGSRITATDEDGNRVSVSYNDALNSEPNHAAAARKLCQKMDWRGNLTGGHTKHGMVWVWDDARNRIDV